VNDAPTGANKTIAALEDTARVLTKADFGFSDADGNGLAAVKITTLPGAGALTLNGAAVAAGQLISVAAIDAGYLKFKGAPNGNGAGYAHFTFQMQDNGGTANGGVNLDQSPNTLTINVSAVDDAPAAINFSNVHAPIAENTSTAAAIKIADVSLADIDGGAKILSLAGADAALFQIVGGDLWLRAGAKLDFETNPLLAVTVNANAPGVGGAIDATRSLAIKVLDAIEIINGDNGPNTLVGGYWTERINGLGGNDNIFGNGGNDRITGGLGADVLTGGPGVDVFVYAAVAESVAGFAGFFDNGYFIPASSVGVRDIIADFTPGQDRIDLSAIDASTAAAGNQAFAWLGAGNFSGIAGQLIVRTYDLAGTTADRTMIYGDVDGDRLADFQVEMTGLKPLAANDFVL
jgi:Ca2+-binding RTX toxin-like protein